MLRIDMPTYSASQCEALAMGVTHYPAPICIGNVRTFLPHVPRFARHITQTNANYSRLTQNLSALVGVESALVSVVSSKVRHTTAIA